MSNRVLGRIKQESLPLSPFSGDTIVFFTIVKIFLRYATHQGIIYIRVK